MSENSSLLLQLPNDTQAAITAYITTTLGDTHIDYHTLLPLTLIYSIFLVVGVCGNLATCVVIVSNEYLRTATNVYLLNLALADIATLIITMPGELYLMWQQYPWTFGEVACDAKIVITEAIIYASILTIVAFTGERYLAICRPLSPLARSTTGEARRVISMIWLFSFLSASPWALFTKVNYLPWEGRQLPESAWCSIPFNESSAHASLYMMLASTLLYFFAPLAVVVFLYTRIGLTLHRNRMSRCAASCQGEDCHAEKTYSQGIRTVIRMLVVVVSAFFFCWTPFWTQRIMFVLVTLFESWSGTLTQVQHVLFTISGVFYYFNSVLNPILYSLMSKRFRRGFSDIKRSFVNRLTTRPESEVSEQKRSGTNARVRRGPRTWIPLERREQLLLQAAGESPDKAEVILCEGSMGGSGSFQRARSQVSNPRSINSCKPLNSNSRPSSRAQCDLAQCDM